MPDFFILTALLVTVARSTFAALSKNFKSSLEALEKAKREFTQLNKRHDSDAYIAKVKRNLYLAKNNARNSQKRLLARTRALGRNF